MVHYDFAVKDVVVASGNKLNDRMVGSQTHEAKRDAFGACLEKAKQGSPQQHAPRNRVVADDQRPLRARLKHKLPADKDSDPNELDEPLITEIISTLQNVSELTDVGGYPAVFCTEELSSVQRTTESAANPPVPIDPLTASKPTESSGRDEQATHLTPGLVISAEDEAMQSGKMSANHFSEESRPYESPKRYELKVDVHKPDGAPVDDRSIDVGSDNLLAAASRPQRSVAAASTSLGKHGSEVPPTAVSMDAAGQEIATNTKSPSSASPRMPVRFGSIHTMPMGKENSLDQRVASSPVDAAAMPTLDMAAAGGQGKETDELAWSGSTIELEEKVVKADRSVGQGDRLVALSDHLNITSSLSYVQQGDGSLPVASTLTKQLETYLMQATSVQLSNGETSEMQITLEPQELGKLAMRITMENGMIAARFEAESHVVKQLIEAELPRLKDTLQQQGIRLDQVSVQVGGGQAHGFGERQMHHRQFNWSSRPRRELSAGVVMLQTPRAGTVARPRLGYSVDYTV